MCSSISPYIIQGSPAEALRLVITILCKTTNGPAITTYQRMLQHEAACLR